MSILGFFTRARPGSALNKAATVSNLNRVANILETIEGEGCRIEKPLDQEGRGWRVVVDGETSDTPGWTRPDFDASRYFPFHVRKDAGGFWWCVPGAVYLNDETPNPLPWDSSRYDRFYTGENVYLTIYNHNGNRLDRYCALTKDGKDPETGSSPVVSYCVARITEEGKVDQLMEGDLHLNHFIDDKGCSIKLDTQDGDFFLKSDRPATLDSASQDLLLRGFAIDEYPPRLFGYSSIANFEQLVSDYCKDILIHNIIEGVEGIPFDQLLAILEEWLATHTGDDCPSNGAAVNNTPWPEGTVLVGKGVAPGAQLGDATGVWMTLADAIGQKLVPAANEADLQEVNRLYQEVNEDMTAAVGQADRFLASYQEVSNETPLSEMRTQRAEEDAARLVLASSRPEADLTALRDSVDGGNAGLADINRRIQALGGRP